MLICNCLDLENNKTHAIMIKEFLDDKVILAKNTAETLDHRTLEVIQTTIVNILDKDEKEKSRLNEVTLGMGIHIDYPSGTGIIVQKPEVQASKVL